MEMSHDHGRTYAEIEQTMGLDHSEGKGKPYRSLCYFLAYTKDSVPKTKPSCQFILQTKHCAYFVSTVETFSREFSNVKSLRVEKSSGVHF